MRNLVPIYSLLIYTVDILSVAETNRHSFLMLLEGDIRSHSLAPSSHSRSHMGPSAHLKASGLGSI